MSLEVSIIIPTYKPKEYIFKCLKSIKSQTFNHSLFEVIIILNGEKDPYFNNLSNYVHENFINARLIYCSQSGVSNARNLGLESAIGSNIVFLDDDDYISANYLDLLIKMKNDDISVVVSNLKCVKNDNLFDDYYSKAFNNLENSHYNLLKYRKFLSSPCAKLIDRKVIGNIRFDLGLKTSEDALFCFEISKNIKKMILANHECIYYRLIRDNSASRKNEEKFDLLKEYFLKIRKLSTIFFKSFTDYSTILYLTRILAFSKLLLNRIKK